MAKHKTVVIDEIHVTVRVPGDLPDDEANVVREVLVGDKFMSRLRRAVRLALREFPDLHVVRAGVAR
jgi:2'-5' RNA ligase